MSKSGKMSKLLKENLKLREQVLQLESAVSSLNSKSLVKDNKLQIVLNSQKNLEKALAKKVAELKQILIESRKQKENAFNRIVDLEHKCDSLTKKIVQQSDELVNVKSKYIQLKQKLKKQNESIEVPPLGSREEQVIDENQIKTEQLNRNHFFYSDKSTSKIEVRNQGIQVGDIFDNYDEDGLISDLFFIPTTHFPDPPLPDLDMFNKYSWYRNLYEQTKLNENSEWHRETSEPY